MLRRKTVLILSAFLLTAFVAIWFFRRGGEPHFKGRSITRWTYEKARAELEGDLAHAEEATKAIQAVGTNGIPFIIERMSQKRLLLGPPSMLVDVPYLGEWTADLAIERMSDHEIGTYATVDYFYVLGPQCKSAIPLLTNLVQASSDPDTQSHAIRSLLQLGDDALPFLGDLLANPGKPSCVQAVYCLHERHLKRITNAAILNPHLVNLSTNTNQLLARGAVRALGNIRLQPEIVLPVLTNALSSKNVGMRVTAVHALGRFAQHQYVELALHDPDPDVRRAATKVKRKLSPRAETAKTRVEIDP